MITRGCRMHAASPFSQEIASRIVLHVPGERAILETLLYILAKGFQIYVTIVTFAIFARVIISRFGDEDGLLYMLLFIATEPAIVPVRALMERMNWLQGLPFDFSPAISMFILNMVSAFMPQL